MAGYTISMSQGDHAEEHSRRKYTPMSAEASLTKDNVVIFDAGDDKTHFNKFFADAIEAYNERQVKARHPERQKSMDYYSDLLNGVEGYGKGKTQEKPIYDDVLQIGNRDTNGVTKRTFNVDHWRSLKADGKYHEAELYVAKHKNNDPTREELTQILEDEAKYILSESANSREYRKKHGLPPGKYDNILIHRIIIHRDEPNGTDHIDIAYTIFTDEGDTKRKDGRQNGLSRRVSARKGLEKMGFKKSRDQFALEKFRESIKDEIQERMESRGYQRDIKGEHRRHLSPQMFEVEQRAKEAEAKVEAEEEKLANLQEESAGLSDRIAKVEEGEESLRIRKHQQDEEHKQRTEDLNQTETELLDFRDQAIQYMRDIFDKLKEDDEEEDLEFSSMTELTEKVDRQVKRWGDAVDQRETAVGAREAKIDDMIKTIEDIQASAVNAEVFETETLSDGRKIPKRLRDEHGRIQKDANGKVMLAPARKINDVIEDLNRMKAELESKRADFDMQATEKELER